MCIMKTHNKPYMEIYRYLEVASLNQIHVLILDEDMEYSNALGVSLTNLMADCFVSVGNPHVGPVKPGPTSMILATPGCIPFLDSDLTKERIIYLTEDASQSGENEKQIYKYQSVALIASELRYFYAQMEGREISIPLTEACRMLVMTSACGGSGQTAAALTLARILSSSYGKRVLYLNGESMNSSGCYLPDHGAGNRSISDFIFHLFQKEKTKESKWARSYLLQDSYGVHYFPTSSGVNAFCGLTPAETLLLIDTLKTQCQMDLILLDLESGLTEQTLTIVQACDGILLMEGADPVSQWKRENFQQILEQMVSSGSRIWIQSVLLPRDPQSFVAKGSIIEILMHQDYGSAAHHLAEQVEGWML